jgi:hypothetical protein
MIVGTSVTGLVATSSPAAASTWRPRRSRARAPARARTAFVGGPPGAWGCVSCPWRGESGTPRRTIRSGSAARPRASVGAREAGRGCATRLFAGGIAGLGVLGAAPLAVGELLARAAVTHGPSSRCPRPGYAPTPARRRIRSRKAISNRATLPPATTTRRDGHGCGLAAGPPGRLRCLPLPLDGARWRSARRRSASWRPWTRWGAGRSRSASWPTSSPACTFGRRRR